MKNKISPAILICASFFLFLSCSSKSDNSNFSGNRSSSNQNPSNQNSVNQTANQTSPDSGFMTNTASNVQPTPVNPDTTYHSDMQTAPDANNAAFDLQFLDTMIAHHQGAVVMAKPAMEKSAHSEVRELAQNIVVSQEKEIDQMRDWRGKWYSDKPMAMNMEMPGMADSMRGMDMQKLQSLSGNDFDLAFIQMMIPHHEGALKMAQLALEKAEHPEIKTLAQAIIMEQETEIKTMQNWKDSWSK